MVKLYVKVGLFLLLIFFVLISPLGAKVVTKQSSQCFEKIAGDNEEFIKYRKDFIDLYNLFLNNDIVALESFIDTTTQNREMPKYIMFYFNASANYYLGLLTLGVDKNEDGASVYFNKAKDLIASSLEYNDKFNESLRLASNIYRILISIQPIMGMFYGPISDSYTSKSYLFNTNNPLLHISFGEGFYYTPFLFGGDKDRAKEMFERAYDSCPLFEETSYRVLWYDFVEDEIDKETCDFYLKDKSLMNIKIYEDIMMKVKKQCDLLNEKT